MGGAAFFGAIPLDSGPLQVGQLKSSAKESPLTAIKTNPEINNRNIESPFNETELVKVLICLLVF